jgi:hypothetical protein
MLLMAVLLAATPAFAACPADATGLRADVAVAVKAYDDWDWAAFDQGVHQVREDLSCLTEVLPGPAAQSAHQLFALAGGRKQDVEQATAAFRGIIALDSSYTPDPALAPEGSLLRKAWATAGELGPGAGKTLPEGAWFVDGQPGATELPVERAAVVQLLESNRGFLSWYLDGRVVPTDLAERLPAPEPITSTTDLVQGSDRSRMMLSSGIAAIAVGAAGLFIGEGFENQIAGAPTREDADRYYSRGLTSTFGGLAVGLAGSALVVGGLVQGRW